MDKTYLDTWETRNSTLKISYLDYLNSAEWKEIKRKTLLREHYKKCWICGCSKKLEIHHRSYKWIGTKDCMRGLVAVCRNCHEKIHILAKEKGISVRLATNRLKNESKRNREET